MMKTLVRAWWWLLGCLAFFTVFAFALNNRAVVTVHWFFGYQSSIQLVLLVLLTLMLGVFLGALAVLPLWWRQYRLSRAGAPAQPQAPPAPEAAIAAAPDGRKSKANTPSDAAVDTGVIDAV